MAANFTLTSATDLFKELYVGGSDIQFNHDNVLWMKIKKSYGDFVSKKIYRGTQLAMGGGIATSSTLPTVNTDTSNYDQAELETKFIYSIIELSGQAIAQGSNERGLFDRSAMQHEVERAVKKCNRLLSVVLFGNGDGSVYTGNASNTQVSGTGAACDPYVINCDGDQASFVPANIEEGDIVHVGAETTDLIVSDVVTTAGSEAIKLVGTSSTLATRSGSAAFGASDVLYFENSKDAAPLGLGILELTSGSSYNISHTKRRWKGNKISASGAINEDLLNQLVLDVKENSGEDPDMIVCSYYQYRKIKDFMSDHKHIEIKPADERLVGKIGFSALQFMSDGGPIPVIADRFCPKGKIYALNSSKIEFITAPDWGWKDRDGSVFMRRDTTDNYQARYGGYAQIYIQPHFHGVITGLSVSIS